MYKAWYSEFWAIQNAHQFCTREQKMNRLSPFWSGNTNVASTHDTTVSCNTDWLSRNGFFLCLLVPNGHFRETKLSAKIFVCFPNPSCRVNAFWKLETPSQKDRTVLFSLAADFSQNCVFFLATQNFSRSLGSPETKHAEIYVLNRLRDHWDNKESIVLI